MMLLLFKAVEKHSPANPTALSSESKGAVDRPILRIVPIVQIVQVVWRVEPKTPSSRRVPNVRKSVKGVFRAHRSNLSRMFQPLNNRSSGRLSLSLQYKHADWSDSHGTRCLPHRLTIEIPRLAVILFD
jgi:hypothetical protein